MVMIFAHEKVREYLLEHGIVYSFRKNHPKTSDGVRKQIGDDWANAKRGGKKIADIHITPMQTLNLMNVGLVLTRYAQESGFYLGHGQVDAAVDEWVKAIENLNSGYIPAGWIYKVEIREAS